MNNINAKIEVKRKQIAVEVDPARKEKHKKQLQVLQIRKQIIDLQNRIENLNN